MSDVQANRFPATAGIPLYDKTTGEEVGHIVGWQDEMQDDGKLWPFVLFAGSMHAELLACDGDDFTACRDCGCESCEKASTLTTVQPSIQLQPQ